MRDVIHSVTFKHDEESSCKRCGVTVPSEIAAIGSGDVIQIGTAWVPVMNRAVEAANAIECTSALAKTQVGELPEVELREYTPAANEEVVKPLKRTEREKAAVRDAINNWAMLRDMTRPDGVQSS